MAAAKAKPAQDMVEVYLDCEFTHGPILVGTLRHDSGQVSFEYHQAWIANRHAFERDPGLTLAAEPLILSGAREKALVLQSRSIPYFRGWLYRI